MTNFNSETRPKRRPSCPTTTILFLLLFLIKLFVLSLYLQDEYVSQDYDSGNSDPGNSGSGNIEEDISDCGLDQLNDEVLLCPKGDCMAVAAAHLAAGRFDKAILAYTSALKNLIHDEEGDKETQIQLLLGRCDAYCSLSRHLRTIPAAQSERHAVYAPDPHSLATSALKDAEHAFNLESSRAGAVHKARGDALFLLERYADARDAYSMAYTHVPVPCLNAKMISCEQALCDGNGSGSSAMNTNNSQSYCAIGAGTGPAGAAGSTPPMSCSARLIAIKQQALQDAECTLCLKLLYEPVTTPCGHTFCSPCLARSYDHANKCPMCRTVLHVGQLPVSIVLKNILERSFPEEYEMRKCEETNAASFNFILPSAATAAAGAAVDGSNNNTNNTGGVAGSPGAMNNNTNSNTSNSVLPLFVMSPMLPGERMALNIFEPRYRLMLRRVMAGGRRFGMATVNPDHSLHDVCCEVEITECETLPDGRYYIEIVGRRRFRPRDAQEQDGYRVARAEYFTDDVPERDSAADTELENISTEVEVMADAWMGRMRRLGQSRRAAAELLRRVEPKPVASPSSRNGGGGGASVVRRDQEKLSFWVANLVCPLIDDVGVKLRMLCMTSTVDRLKLCKGVLQQLQDASLGGCCVM
jgi:Lon protease-like protein